MEDIFYFMLFPVPVNLDKPHHFKEPVNHGRTSKMKLSTDGYVRAIRKGGMTYDEAITTVLENNGIAFPPIGVVSIARNMGFDVFTATFKDENLAGIMVDSDKDEEPFNSKRVIAINKNDPPDRKQFTLAHEIGHFVLHCNEESNFFERYLGEDADTSNKALEQQANFFAACLLMPAKMVKDLYSTYMSSTDSPSRAGFIDKIRRTFIVSHTAADRRIDELSLEF